MAKNRKLNQKAKNSMTKTAKNNFNNSLFAIANKIESFNLIARDWIGQKVDKMSKIERKGKTGQNGGKWDKMDKMGQNKQGTKLAKLNFPAFFSALVVDQ